MSQPNRKERRHAARRGRVVPMVKMGLLTIPEAELIAEWADAYLLQQERDLPTEEERTELQRWSVARTAQLRNMLQASVESRPTYDEHAERVEPVS